MFMDTYGFNGKVSMSRSMRMVCDIASEQILPYIKEKLDGKEKEEKRELIKKFREDYGYMRTIKSFLDEYEKTLE